VWRQVLFAALSLRRQHGGDSGTQKIKVSAAERLQEH
jgi:hypothetical protein